MQRRDSGAWNKRARAATDFWSDLGRYPVKKHCRGKDRCKQRQPNVKIIETQAEFMANALRKKGKCRPDQSLSKKNFGSD